MESNKIRIESILANGEHINLECKKATNTIPNSIWETYSSFANTYGGTILLGIVEDLKEKDIKKRFQVVGVEDSQKIITDFWNTINSNKVNENILSDNDVNVIDIDGKKVICINVPQADWRIKPIYLNDNIYKGTYKRNQEGDYRCTERQVRAMIRDSFEEGNDGILIEHYNMDDIDLDSLHRYRNLFRVWNADHIWNEVDDKTFLRNLGGYIVNRADGKEGLSMAGLMMFGKGLSIRERFDNFRMEYLNFCNLIGEERYSDRLTYDGRWENNLYQFFSIVLPKMTFDLPRPFRMEGMQRVDDTPQHKAVREAFTNAIIHADLMMESAILRIEKHDDKLCFRNPGLLRLPLEQIYEGGNSKARNPRIQNMLRMIGFGENIGSGFPQIIAAWKDTKWGEPELKNKIELDEVELVLPLGKVANVVNNDRKDDRKELTERQKCIIELLIQEPTLTAKAISEKISEKTSEKTSEKFEVSDRTIENDLAQLKKMGILIREGGRKDGRWVVLLSNKELFK
jgi:predicted HTH transcriptional regulator